MRDRKTGFRCPGPGRGRRSSLQGLLRGEEKVSEHERAPYVAGFSCIDHGVCTPTFLPPVLGGAGYGHVRSGGAHAQRIGVASVGDQ